MSVCKGEGIAITRDPQTCAGPLNFSTDPKALDHETLLTCETRYFIYGLLGVGE